MWDEHYLYELPTLALPTDESGYSSWPTIRALESGDYCYSRGDHDSPVLTLTGAVKAWSTLTAQDCREVPAALRPSRIATGRQTNYVSREVQMWATVTTSESTGASRAENKAGGDSLRTQTVDWSTPRGSDGAKGGPNQRGSKGDMMLPSQAVHFCRNMTPTELEPASGLTAWQLWDTTELQGSLAPMFARWLILGVLRNE
jgi:hypothetical protein